MRRRTNWKRVFFYAVLCIAALLLLPASYVGAHYWINAPSSGELPFRDSFPDGDLRAWDDFGMQQLCCDHSAEVGEAPHRPGERAVRFVLNRSDPDVKGSRRAELRLHAAEFGQEYKYSLRVFVPKEWVIDPAPVTVIQWHNVPDLWRGEWALPSVLRVDIRGGEWVVELYWGTGPRWFDRRRDLHSATLWRGPLDRDKWTDWSFRIKWSYGEDGIVDVWKDDSLIAHHVGPSAYVGTLAPYLKFGLYAWWWAVHPDRPTATDRREIWFSDVHVTQNG